MHENSCIFFLFKQITDLFSEAFFFCHIGAVAAVVKLAQKLFLVLGKIGGDFDLDGEIQVSAAIGANDGDPFAFEGELRSRLRTLGNSEAFLAL